jgi:hypothetical protein
MRETPRYLFQQQCMHRDQIQEADCKEVRHDLHNHHNPKIISRFTLTLAKKAYIECHTSTFSAPGASSL